MVIFHSQYPNLEVHLQFPLARMPSRIHTLGNREESLQHLTQAISPGILNDLGFRWNVDTRFVTATGMEMLRSFVKPDERVKEMWYVFRTGTMVLKEEVMW